MSKNKELIWVDEEFAEKHKLLEDDKTKKEEQIRIFNEYLEGIQEASRAEFKANFESLDEDVAIYKGLMLNVKQAFGKAKTEQLQASYALWEEFNKDLPDIQEKTAKIVETLTPLADKLTQINDLLGKIQTWNFKAVIEIIEKISCLYGNNKDMVEFLVNHYMPKEEKK